MDNRSRRSSRGNGGFFIDSIGPSRLGRKNRRKEKGEKEIEAESSKNKTYARQECNFVNFISGKEEGE